MSRALEGKAVVVTGAGQGIGEATARLAATLGASVLVNDLDAQRAERVAADIRDSGQVAEAFPCDISIWKSGEALVGACVARFGRIDGLVNNAGLFRLAPLSETSEIDFRATFEVNLLGTAACARAAARHMMQQGSGSIVNVTSGAQTGMLGLGAYGASKGAVASLTYAWALELAGSGVRLNAVSPMADGPMADATRAYLAQAQVALPATVPAAATNAPAICYLLSDLSAGIHGQVLRVDGPTLGLMTHPAILAPLIEDDSWTVEKVARAFADDLGSRQQQLGVVKVSCTPA